VDDKKKDRAGAVESENKKSIYDNVSQMADHIGENIKGKGIRLARHSRRSIFRVLFSRIGLIILFLAAQIWFLFALYSRFAVYFRHISNMQLLLVVLVIIYLMNSSSDSSSKATWLAMFSFIPVFSALLLIFIKADAGHRNLKKEVSRLSDAARDYIPQDYRVLDELEEESPDTASLVRYVNRTGNFPVFKNTEVLYCPLGEDAFAQMMIQLEKAEKFIFIEFFIIGEGVMWGKILEILARKAKEGVDVRVMYDATCDLSLLPYNYPKRVESLGIHCRKFDPLTPFISTRYNYRDHRKILVIDGHTAFTGGINMSDEYINVKCRFGHWKDTAVMLRGEAVRSMTLMFLQMWQLYDKELSFKEFVEDPVIPFPTESAGYVMPFSDSPMDNDKVGERVFMDILNHARHYVYIMTPYLILDDELLAAVCFAAERGVNVKILLPGVPDKKVVYDLAKTYFPALLKSGVEIYLYEPGFLHAKEWVSDDCRAFVGTINMDYRSLYHHFECGVYMYRPECIDSIKHDFADTIEKCRLVDMRAVQKENPLVKITGALARVFAPLL